MSHTLKRVMWKDEEEDRKGVPMEHPWRLCGGGVNHSQVHERGKTRMKHQRLCAGGVVHSSVNRRGETPMEH